MTDAIAGWDHIIPGEKWDEWKARVDAQRCTDLVDAGGIGWNIGRCRKGADRTYRGRMVATMDRGMAHAAKAQDMAGRAAGIEAQLARAIYDDDPDAVERLTERVATLEAQRDRIKAANAAYRKEHKAELAALTPYGRDQVLPHRGFELTPPTPTSVGTKAERSGPRPTRAERASTPTTPKSASHDLRPRPADRRLRWPVVASGVRRVRQGRWRLLPAGHALRESGRRRLVAGLPERELTDVPSVREDRRDQGCTLWSRWTRPPMVLAPKASLV